MYEILFCNLGNGKILQWFKIFKCLNFYHGSCCYIHENYCDDDTTHCNVWIPYMNNRVPMLQLQRNSKNKGKIKV